MKESKEQSQAAFCHTACSNMYKQCNGVCMKKRGHSQAHKCSHCGYSWSSRHPLSPLSVQEQARSLPER